MTLAELIDSPTEVFESISEEELDKICEPFFKVTRPEHVSRETKDRIAKKVSLLTPEEQTKKEKIEQAKRMLAAKGIKI